jgi:ABC-2 type transport system permease protein
VNGVAVRASWLLILPLFLAVFAFAAALALLLSVLFVRYRDVQPVWDVALQFVFWGTPIIYTIDFIPEQYRQFVMLNPLAVAVEQGRYWLVGSEVPTAAAVMGSYAKLLLPAAVFVGVIVLSVWTFRRRSASIAEEL